MKTEQMVTSYTFEEVLYTSDEFPVELPENQADLDLLKVDVVVLGCRQFRTDVLNKARTALQQANGHAKATKETKLYKAMAEIMADDDLSIKYKSMVQEYGAASAQVQNWVKKTYNQVFAS